MLLVLFDFGSKILVVSDCYSYLYCLKNKILHRIYPRSWGGSLHSIHVIDVVLNIFLFSCLNFFFIFLAIFFLFKRKKRLFCLCVTNLERLLYGYTHDTRQQHTFSSFIFLFKASYAYCCWIAFRDSIFYNFMNVYMNNRIICSSLRILG